MSQCQAQWEILLALVRLLLPHLLCHLLMIMSHFDDSDSDSASEPHLDDSDDPPFVPDPVDDSEPVLGSPPSPSALPDSTPEPLPPSDEPGPSASSHQSESPTPPSDSQDSRDSPAPSEPYKAHSGTCLLIRLKLLLNLGLMLVILHPQTAPVTLECLLHLMSSTRWNDETIWMRRLRNDPRLVGLNSVSCELV